MVLIIVVATVIMLTWVFLLIFANQEDYVEAAYIKILKNIDLQNKLKTKDISNQRMLLQYSGLQMKLLNIFISTDSSKKINKLEKDIEGLKEGGFGTINIFLLPGYCGYRKFGKNIIGRRYKVLHEKCTELYGEKYGDKYANYTIACAISIGIGGVGLALAIGTQVFINSGFNTGIMVMAVGVFLATFVAYAVFDEINSKAKKRREEISRDFPAAVSKLALLTTSGMIISKAWDETGESGEGVLYEEMRAVRDKMAQSISPEQAYGGFILKCNTKETAKLASSILQGMSKGNQEIAVSLKRISSESWQEKKNNTKKIAEKANAKLMIPSMLLLVTILVMIMVPVMANFNG